MDLRKEIISEIDEKHKQLMCLISTDDPEKVKRILDVAYWLQTLKDELKSPPNDWKRLARNYNNVNTGGDG